MTAARYLHVSATLPRGDVIDLPVVSPGRAGSLSVQEPQGRRTLVFQVSPSGDAASLVIMEMFEECRVGPYVDATGKAERCERVLTEVGQTYERPIRTRWGRGTLRMSFEDTP